MKLKEFVDNLESAGLDPVVLTDANSAVVVLPQGARILGVFSSPKADNPYYVNPELLDPDTGRIFAHTPGVVLGGDRLWLAPERGIFFYGPEARFGEARPQQVDPGNYILSAAEERRVLLINHFQAPYFCEGGGDISGVIQRDIRILAHPYRHSPELLKQCKGVDFVGYEIQSSLAVDQAPAHLCLGLWFLIQLAVPVGGFVYIPTLARTVVTDYYEPTGADYLRVTDDHVRFKLDSIFRHKIGVRKTEATGRVAYLTNPDAKGQATLVIRNFLNNPAGDYADVPLHTPSGTQDSIQSYNHFDLGTEGMGEIEFHAPGIRVDDDALEPAVTRDVNQVFIFTGPRAQLIKIAARELRLLPEVFAL